MPVEPTINPYPSYEAQTKTLQRAFEDVVTANEKTIEVMKRGMAGDYRELLKKLKAIVANAHEQYSRKGQKLNWQELNRFNRIKRLEEDINKAITEQYSPIRKRAIQDMKIVVENTYGGGISAINAAAVSLNANIVPVKPEISGKMINEILSRPWSGISPQERLYLRQKYLGVQINGQIKRDVMGEGSTYAETAKNLEKIITKDFAGTAKDVENSAHQLQSDTQQQVIDRMSEEELVVTKTWVAVMDDRTRDAHRLLDGQTVDASEFFEIPSGDYAGFKADGPSLFGVDSLDISCRCFLVAGIKKRGDVQ
jgi:hypothetical protein